MGLLGESWDDPKSQGLLALASGMLQGNLGAGVANFNQTMANAPDVAMKRKLMTEELAMKQLAEKRAQASFEQNQALYKMFQGGDTSEGVQGAQVSPGQGSAQGGMVAGVPRNAALADLALNGGKNVPEWMYKQGIPDMQVSNGVAYDKNRLKSGFLPGMSVSQNGQASLTTIGPDGLPQVSAPAGALDTAAAYKRAEASLKPIEVFNPVTQRKEFSNEADVAAPRLSQGEAGMRAQAAGPMGADPAALRREIAATTADLKKTLDPSSRAQLKEHLDGLTATLGSISPSSGRVAAGPSASEAAQNEAFKTGLVDTAKADVVRDTTKQGDAKRYGQLTATADRALKLLESGPTASGLGSAVDSAANFFGKSTKGADAAAELSTLGGWMTANVPRMEGPQSDKDVAQYRIMAGAVGDKTIPISQRIAAAKELKLLQDKYADLNGYASQTGGVTGDFSPTKPARTATMADIAATAKASGKTTAEVTKAMKAAGYTIGSM